MTWHQFLLALLFIVSGIFHLKKPKIYLKIMPPYLPFPKALVVISGIAELTAGIGLCLFNSQRIAVWAIIGMLITFLPVHIQMLTDIKTSMGPPKCVLIARIPLQLVFIYWAFQYA